MWFIKNLTEIRQKNILNFDYLEHWSSAEAKSPTGGDFMIYQI